MTPFRKLAIALAARDRARPRPGRTSSEPSSTSIAPDARPQTPGPTEAGWKGASIINARRHQDFTDRQHPDVGVSCDDHVGHIGATRLQLDAAIRCSTALTHEFESCPLTSLLPPGIAE